MKKRLISLLLVVVMLAGMVPALGITITAATPTVSEGMTFKQDELFKIPYKLDVSKPATGDEAITFEAEIFIPYNKRNDRNGVIVGTYTDDEQVGKTSTDMNFEIQTNGRLRFYTAHLDNIIFNDDETQNGDSNVGDTNIFNYMGGETEAKFAKIAFVINVTQKTAKLYINGNLVQTRTMSAAVSGDLKLPQYFYLGGDLRINNTQYFKGNIKNVALYSDVRTDEEIEASAADGYTINADDENLLFAYDLSSGSKANMKDISKNGYNAQFVPKVGKTFTADDNTVMSKPLECAPRTYEATIYMPDIALDNNYRGGVIIGNYNCSTNVSFEIDGSGYPKVFYTNPNNGGEGHYLSSVDVRRYNDWVHVAIVVDESGNSPIIRYYINGENVANQTHQGKNEDGTAKAVLGYNESLASTLVKELKLGGDYRANQAQAHFKGYIKDVTLYSDIRSASEIKSDYQNGANVSDENILVAYDFTKAAEFKDVSGNGYDIKLNEDEGLSFTSKELYRTGGKLSAVPYSFETWIHLPKSYSSRAGVVFGNYKGSGRSSDLCLEIYSNGNPRLFYSGLPKNDYTVFKNVDVRSDNWVHLAVVKDEAKDEIHCYLNGELAQTITGAPDLKSTVATNIEGFGLGGDMRNYATTPSKFNEMYFKGTVLDFAIYSDVRTAAEIKASYEQGINISDKGLISYYDLSSVEDGATKITDVKGKNTLTTDWNLVSGITSDYEYTFAVIGDTQKLVYTDAKNAVNGTTSNYTSTLYQWIVDNKDAQKIKYVIGLGDITDTGNKVSDSNATVAAIAKKEWEIARNASDLLGNAGIDYAIIAGNHENATVFTTYYGDDADLTKNIDGYYRDGKDKLGNYYMNFEINGTKYMILALSFGANDEMLKWANKVVSEHPDRRVIMITHCYMFRDGTRLDQGDVAPPSTANNNGDEMWEKFASQHGNVVLVLSGHDPCENIIYRQDFGINGNLVSQFLIDPQGMDAKTTGMVALLHFSADGKSISVEYVSTHRTATMGSNVYFRNVNQFELELFSDKNNNVYAVTGEADNYTAYYTNGDVTIFNDGKTIATVNGYVVSLEGNIGVNSFMNIPSFSNTDKLYVKFTVDGEESVEYFSDAIKDATYGYGFKGLVSAAQMTSEIKVELYYGDVLLVSNTTSVAEYAKVILESTDNEEYIKAQPVVKAMLNYGAAAQVQFGQNLNKLANSIVTDVTVGNNADKINAAAKSKVSGAIDGVTYRSTTLGLESETALYHFFNVTDTDISKYTVVGADEVVMIGNTLRVKIAGIEAAKLSTEYAVSVTYNGETINVTANAMAYAKAVVNSSAVSDVLKTLMNALYDYNVAMVAYNG